MLKSLELFGFKSFADKTVFEFHTGITGVVGPNGSGKSNVVDSIKWILGDQSAKSLRGKEMTDVIFNGSASRGGAQFAEATLVFDNTTRFLPLDYDEVSIGRRLWKTGDSEYLINRTPSRLKDVRELLMGTGAGAASYCIIEQGRVDQILQSNAANRRLIFEEAANISRFKQRRNEAERRLERVEQNLLRLNDIVDEVESQVNAVRGQAKRAAQYRTVSTELEKLWVGMVADDFRRQSMVRQKLQQQQEEASQNLVAIREHQALAEQQLAEADKALSTVDDELREVERSRSDLRSRIASLETTLRHHIAREAELASEGSRLQRQQALMDGRVSEAEKEQIHLNHVLELEQKRFDERRAEQATSEARLLELRSSLQTAHEVLREQRLQLSEQSRQASEIAARVGGLRHELQSLEQRRQELTTARDVLKAEIAELEVQVTEAKDAEQKAQQQLQSAEEVADRLLNARESLISEQTQSRESLADLREQRSAAVARRTVLEDLEDRQEGFGIGAREILRRAEEGTAEPWSLIRGSVADLLDVDMENAALLEVALAGRAQLLVIDRLQPMIDYMNAGRCQITDRVGFVSLEGIQPTDIPTAPQRRMAKGDSSGDIGRSRIPDPGRTWTGELALGMFGDDWLDADFSMPVSEEFVPELKVTWLDENGEIPAVRSVFASSDANIVTLAGRPGVVGRADSLARSPRHLPNLATQLLADTWVVQTLNDALRLQDEFGDDYRFVTLQGELVEKDRTLYTGAVRSETAVVSRKSELRRLKNELLRIEHLISERDHRLQKLVASIESADEELQAARDAVERHAAELRVEQQNLAERQQSLRSNHRNEQRLNDQLTQIDSSIETLKQKTRDEEAALTEATEEVESLQAAIDEAENALAEDRRQVEILEESRTQTNLEITRSEERLLGIRDAVERLAEDLEQRRLQQQEAGRRLNAGNERLGELNLNRLNAGAEAAELRFMDDQLTWQVLRRGRARQRLKERKQEAAVAEQKAREVCRQQEALYHETELKVHNIEHQLATSAERIRDEFQISVEDAVNEGRSGIAAWLTERAKPNQGNRRNSDSDADGDDDSEEISAAVQSSDDLFAEETIEYTIDDPQVAQILRSDERYEEMRQAIDQRVSRLRRQIRKIGNVSTESLDNLNELETRFHRLHSQLKDLEAARDALREMVRQINVESRRMFEESFECIRGHFRELFRRLFGGGEADVILEDPEDVLECSIDVVARPPGKELRSISLLSGGEKTMTAVALLLSIFKSRPSPFCILDEVDAALDDANIGRFVGVLKEFQKDTQFIMITHRKPTMAVTDVLYGVTMEESGISKRLVVRFEEIDEKGNFVPRDQQKNKAA